jgi:SHS family lactate transporter-like MFS transporter
MVSAAIATRPVSWWREPTKDQWFAYIAAWLGWTLDAFDFTIFLLIMLPISQEFNVPLVAVTAVFTVTLWLRLLGATAAGWMADRMGRRAPLMISILWYSICNFVAGFSPTFAFLFFFRALLGIGMGAEWPAGAALAMESWPARSRGFMSGLLQGSWGIGYALSSACFYGLNGRSNPLYGILPFAGPTIGWREMLWIGILPALVCVWVRFFVKEPEVWAENNRLLQAQQSQRPAPAVSLQRRIVKSALTFLAWLPNAAVVGGALFLALDWALPFVLQTKYNTMIAALSAAYLTVFLMPSLGHMVDAKLPLLFRIFLPGMVWNTFTACLWMASAFCVYYSIWALFPTYLQLLQKEGGITAWESWAALFFANLVVVVGSGLWGVVADHWGRRWAIIAPSLLAIAVTPVYLMTADPQLIVLGFIAQGIFGGSIYGQNPSYLSERYPTEVRGAAAGLIYHQGAIWGGLVAPVLTYLAVDQKMGFALPMMYSTIGFLVVVVIAVFFGPETKGKVLTGELDPVTEAAH